MDSSAMLAIVWIASILIMVLVIYPISIRVFNADGGSLSGVSILTLIGVCPLFVVAIAIFIAFYSLGYLLHIADLVNRAMVKVAVND